MTSGGNEMVNDRLPVSEEERVRADVYRLLAALLASPPDDRLIGLLRDIEPAHGPMQEAWEKLRQKACDADTSRLNDEYHALFIGLGRGELNPYASWYLTGYLMEKPLANLRGELEQLGIGRAEGVSEPEDHAAALCETMALIISENRLSFERSKNFFETYLGSWLGKFFADLVQASSADFFKVVGDLGIEFIGVEKQYYEMLA